MSDYIDNRVERRALDLQDLSLSPNGPRSSGDTFATGNASVQNGDNIQYIFPARIQETDLTDENAVTDALIRSLTFRCMNARMRNVVAPHKNTAEWTFRDQRYQSWLDTNADLQKSFLWIKGKPGCGKSTLLKEALTRVQDTEWIVAHYFFNERGKGRLEKSALGLYRSFTYQILEALPHLKINFVHEFGVKVGKTSVEEWTESELQSFLLGSVRSRGLKLCLFIDALNESVDGDVGPLISFLEDLCQSGDDVGNNVRICLTTRHFPSRSSNHGVSIVVEEEDEHRIAIEFYVYDRITIIDHDRLEELAAAVCSKSNSVFLWVVLVVRILNQEHDKGHDMESLFLKLAGIQDNLNALFIEIIHKSTEEVLECVTILQWVLYAIVPLTPIELYTAIQYSLPGTPQSENSVEVPQDADILRYLTHCSRGLVGFTKTYSDSNSDSVTVGFIHEDVRTFLLSEEGTSSRCAVLGQVHHNFAFNDKGFHHDTMKNTCFRSLCSTKLPNECVVCNCERERTKDAFRPVWTDRNLKFSSYAGRWMLQHAEIAQTHGIEQCRFLESLQADSDAFDIDSQILAWISHYAIISDAQVCPLGETVLHLIVHQGLLNLLDTVLRNSRPESLVLALNTCAHHTGTPLHIACRNSDYEIVQRLIAHGANIQAEDDRQRIPEDIASAQNDVRMLRLLSSASW